MKIILLGAQGSGKGTLAKQLKTELDIPHLSVGDLFRESIAKKEKLGLEAQSYMNKGVLVPDELTLKILNERITKPDCKKGFILDGFPRSIEQAEALKKITDIDIVLNLVVPVDVCLSRLTSRRTCKACGEIDNTALPGYTGVCRKCGAQLFQRDDDKPEAIKTRLEVYEKTTTPLINFYGGKVCKIKADEGPEKTYELVKPFLKKLEAKK